LINRPELYLEFAAFEEEHNNHERAENLYQTVMKMGTSSLHTYSQKLIHCGWIHSFFYMFTVLFLSQVPNHVESTMRYINFKRRQRDYEMCCRLYEEAITKAKSPLSVAFLSMHYARFLEKVTTNTPSLSLSLSLSFFIHDKTFENQTIENCVRQF
jgi:hypothetical protein